MSTKGCKQGVEGGPYPYIKVRVVSSCGKEVHLNVKMTILMGKLKNVVAQELGLPMNFLRFLFDGKRIRDEDTPDKLEMENDDIIEVFYEQDGGFC